MTFLGIPGARKVFYTFAGIAAVCWALFLLRVIRNESFPIASVFTAGPAFEDAWIYRLTFSCYHSAQFFVPEPMRSAFAYPPLAAILYDALYQVFRPDFVFVGIAAAWVLTAFAGAWRALFLVVRDRRDAAGYAFGAVMFCFAAVFLVERGNIELFVWMLTAGAGLACVRGRSFSAAVLIGLAAAVKLYPILLLGLFLGRRRDLPVFFTGIAAAAGSTLAALLFTGPSLAIAARGFLTGIIRFQSGYAARARPKELGFDHSLFSPFKLWASYLGVSSGPWAHFYYPIAGVLLTTAFWLRIRRAPFLNRLIFLTCSMLLVPPVSYEYTLVHLYLPLLLLLCLALRKDGGGFTRQTRFWISVTLAMLLTALLPVHLFAGDRFYFASQLQVFPLLALLITCSMAPFAPANPKSAMCLPA